MSDNLRITQGILAEHVDRISSSAAAHGLRISFDADTIGVMLAVSDDEEESEALLSDDETDRRSASPTPKNAKAPTNKVEALPTTLQQEADRVAESANKQKKNKGRKRLLPPFPVHQRELQDWITRMEMGPHLPNQRAYILCRLDEDIPGTVSFKMAEEKANDIKLGRRLQDPMDLNRNV
ncbi:hypothetical protein SLS58_008623 [Diplodia intermedia]|uniref:Uncharacterized protein n=1 Tax=Diplodia intermedia TaxID=856260 RepID=A0ABR3TGR9_9PEZI